MQTNKDELKAAIDAFESMPARMGEQAMKDCTRFCNTHARVLSKAAQAHLSLLDDIQALVEARELMGFPDEKILKEPEKYGWSVSTDAFFIAGNIFDEETASFITTAANIISKWKEKV